MESSFDSLKLVLTKYNKKFIDSLNKPIDLLQFQDKVEKLYGRKIAERKSMLLKQLFSWGNGALSPIAPYWYFVDMEGKLRSIKGDRYDKQIIRNGYFPIFESDDSRWICITLFDETERLIKINFNNYPITIRPCYESFCSWVETAIYCYENECYQVVELNGKKRLILNMDKIQLAEKKYKNLNPRTAEEVFY